MWRVEGRVTVCALGAYLNAHRHLSCHAYRHDAVHSAVHFVLSPTSCVRPRTHPRALECVAATVHMQFGNIVATVNMWCGNVAATVRMRAAMLPRPFTCGAAKLSRPFTCGAAMLPRPFTCGAAHTVSAWLHALHAVYAQGLADELNDRQTLCSWAQ